MAIDKVGISDATDSYWGTGQGETLQASIIAIANDLARRVEALAKVVATSASSYSERGIAHTAYCNGRIKREGEASHSIVCADLTAASQIAAFQQASQETFETILANKPVGKDLLIWRETPQPSRELYPDGLHVRIYARLSWDEVSA